MSATSSTSISSPDTVPSVRDDRRSRDRAARSGSRAPGLRLEQHAAAEVAPRAVTASGSPCRAATLAATIRTTLPRAERAADLPPVSSRRNATTPVVEGRFMATPTTTPRSAAAAIDSATPSESVESGFSTSACTPVSTASLAWPQVLARRASDDRDLRSAPALLARSVPSRRQRLRRRAGLPGRTRQPRAPPRSASAA